MADKTYKLTFKLSNGNMKEVQFTVPEGEPGPAGPAGPQGPQGEKGEDGATGSQGPQGEKGETGATGPQGPQGEIGPAGPVGPEGPQGSAGQPGKDGKDGENGQDGKDGQRGTGLLPITTAPSTYTTAVNGLTPAYRIALSKVKAESSVSEVYAGDTLRYSYYHYPVIYVDASYVYCRTRVSIRGATGGKGETGETGPAGPAGESGVYILSDGETVDDAPASAEVVIDPNGEAVDIPEGGGGGGASSWEDLGSTFEQGTVLAETNPMFVEDEGTFFLMDAVKPLATGDEYIVNWNGTEYPCVCEDYIEEDTPAGWMLGNTSVLGGTQENELPFLIIIPNELMVEILGGITGMIFPLDGTTELTISITGEVEVIHPMPAKYLPELKGQKQIIIDIDNQTASIPFETAWEMSVNELQAVTTVIYDGKEYSVTGFERFEATVQGLELKRFNFAFTLIESLHVGIHVYTGRWQSANGETEVSFIASNNRFFLPELADNPESGFKALKAYPDGAVWDDLETHPLDQLLMQTPNGTRYKITVDNNGTLTATRT